MHTTVSEVQDQERKKKVKAKQKICSSSSPYLYHDSNESPAHSSTLSLPNQTSTVANKSLQTHFSTKFNQNPLLNKGSLKQFKDSHGPQKG